MIATVLFRLDLDLAKAWIMVIIAVLYDILTCT